jgi:hypothetical protein
VRPHRARSFAHALGDLQRKKVRLGIAHEFDDTDFQIEAIDLLQNGVLYPEAFACHSTQRSIQFTEEVAP